MVHVTDRLIEVEAFENCGPGKFRGYDDDTLELAATLLVKDTDDYEALCERVFALLNADDRPNGKVAPSLSVGDVVTIDGKASYAVEALGFRKLGRVIEATREDRDALLARLEEADRTGQVVTTERQRAWVEDLERRR